jgi:hypothetical protein
MPSLVRAVAAALVGSIALAPLIAVAQSAPSAPPVPAASAAAADAPAGSSAAPAKPVVPATGYSYGDPTAPKTQRAERPRARLARAKLAGATAVMSGFETLDDGSTRLFVELSQPVSYDTRAGRSTVVYVLKSAYVDRHNNENPLVTTHFNTPVTSARLVPHGHDLWFVVDLRANVQPRAAMDAAKDGGATLKVAFPKGDYLPPEVVSTSPSVPSPPETTAPAPPAAAATPPVKPVPQASP